MLAVPRISDIFAAVSSTARLGEYELLFELASGGMATLYVARHVVTAVERLVAVKRVHRHVLAVAGIQAMFRDEARIAALIRHPNVVRVLDVVEHDGELLIVLDYIESVSLAALGQTARSAGERLPAPIVARVLADALAGLHAAHEATDVRGEPLAIVHRDFSPQNVLVGIDGISHLIDFGVAKAAARITSTESGVLKGKFQYMSPEQARGTDIDRRSDVFSAGVVLFEAVTGALPFGNDASDPSAILLRIVLDPIPKASSLAPGVPPALDDVLDRALERVRDERYQTAGEMLHALVAAVPPASHADVQAYVESRCSAAITERREQLKRALIATDATVADASQPQNAAPLAASPAGPRHEPSTHEPPATMEPAPHASEVRTSPLVRTAVVAGSVTAVMVLVGAGVLAGLAWRDHGGGIQARITDAPLTAVSAKDVVPRVVQVAVDDAPTIATRDAPSIANEGNLRVTRPTRAAIDAATATTPPRDAPAARLAAANDDAGSGTPSFKAARPPDSTLATMGISPDGTLRLRGHRIVARPRVVTNTTVLPNDVLQRQLTDNRWYLVRNYSLAVAYHPASEAPPAGSLTITYSLSAGQFTQLPQDVSSFADSRLTSFVEGGLLYAFSAARHGRSRDELTGTLVLAVDFDVTAEP